MSPSIVPGSPSTEVAVNSAIGYSLESRNSPRIRLSRSAESELNCSTFTTIVPMRLREGSSTSTATSPAMAVVVPLAVCDAPARVSSTE